MRILKAWLGELPSTTFDLGFVGEKNHTRVVIKCSSLFGKYPNAVATMAVDPPVGDIYPVALTKSNDSIIWNISQADIANAGSGQFQLTFTNGEEIIKQEYGRFSVKPSMVTTGEAPDPVQDWISDANGKLAEVEQTIAEVPALVNQKVPVSVSEWLEENVDPSTGYVIDKTLTIENAAADALAVGIGKAPMIRETVSESAVATFPDGANGVPMEVVVGIEPVQDLHGQDAPYPPGGGKNKLPFPYYETTKTDNDITFTVNDDGTIKVNGTASARAIFYISSKSNKVAPPSGSYIFSKASTTGYPVVIIDAYNGTTWVKQLVISGLADNVSFTIDYDGYDRIECYISISSGETVSNILIKPMIRLSSVSDDTYAPYSNICPISGWTGANVSRTGKTLLDDSIKTISGSRLLIGATTNQQNPTYLKAGTYSISVFGINSTYGYLMDKSTALKTIISASDHGTFTVDKDDYYRIDLYGNDAVSGNVTGIMLAYGSTVSETYEPYSGNTYSITFPNPPGTVYGGTLTVNEDGTGTLVVDTEFVSFRWGDVDGTSVGNYTRKIITGRKSNYPHHKYTPVCNVAQYNADYSEDSLHFYVNASESNNVLVFLPNDVDEDTIVQVAYPITTPVTYNLTAEQVGQILSLKGVNNVWASTGNVSVNYSADTKLYIDKKIAEAVANL